MFPGCYIQGTDVIEQLGSALSRFGERGLSVMAPSAFSLLKDRLEGQSSNVELFIEEFNRECCDAEIEQLANIGRERQAQFIIAIGGGKTIDTGKIVADRLNVPVAVVPTIASTDAPCSACAVVYSEEGVVTRIEYQKKNPDLVLVDSGIIANAPVRFLIAGMGDALATWFEAESCQKTKSNNAAGELGSITAYALARLCYDTLLEYGVAAITSCRANAVTPALEHVIEANTLLSGLGFESGGLATAHSIHNGLTVLPQTHNYYHGEKVAMGVLSSLFLTGKSKSQIDEVYSFCESVGLPTTLAEIGLTDISLDDLWKVASQACIAGESIHHEAGEITPQMVVYAMQAANGEGKRRKNIL
ncbi:glycerol dehydrogenase [Candidatus Contubernalis alkalaceticus]|uniref:glycerol dehydrogenase n=1 Tax=Candidatus Contubernalis alkaliaceticus TaxID=338645 RepID=UPI00387E2C7C